MRCPPVAVDAGAGVHRDDPPADLVADDDDRTGPRRDRLERGGQRSVEDRVRPRRIVAHHGAQPERQAVDQHGFCGFRLGQCGDEVAADLDRGPVVGSLPPMARDAVVHLGVARPCRGQEPGPATLSEPARRRQPETALPAARAAQCQDQRAGHVTAIPMATEVTTAANPSSTVAPRMSPSTCRSSAHEEQPDPDADEGADRDPATERDRPGEQPGHDGHQRNRESGADAIKAADPLREPCAEAHPPDRIAPQQHDDDWQCS